MGVKVNLLLGKGGGGEVDRVEMRAVGLSYCLPVLSNTLAEILPDSITRFRRCLITMSTVLIRERNRDLIRES